MMDSEQVTIEQTVIEYLDGVMTVDVHAEKPDGLPGKFILVERLRGSYSDKINTVAIAVQSYADSLLDAAEIDAAVFEAMKSIVMLDRVGGCRLENRYNFTDISEKKYRYQSVYEIRYF